MRGNGARPGLTCERFDNPCCCYHQPVLHRRFDLPNEDRPSAAEVARDGSST